MAADERSGEATADHDDGSSVLLLAEQTAVVWSHATNTSQALVAALTGGDGWDGDAPANFVEADLFTHPDDATPCMGHPPFDPEAVYASVGDWARAWVGTGVAAGCKLDFKDPSCVGPALRVLAGVIELSNAEDPFTDLWLNADVMRGPSGGDPKWESARAFVEDCQAALDIAPVLASRRLVYSLGFTTQAVRDEETGGLAEVYTLDMVRDLHAACRDIGISNVTFALSAQHVAASNPLAALAFLTELGPDTTITFWGSVTRGELTKIEHVLLAGRVADRVYFDVKITDDNDK